jgi:hypothetical protein
VVSTLLAADRYHYDGPIAFLSTPEDERLPDPSVPTAEMVRAMAYPLMMQHRSGIRIATTFGVATSHALQNLKSKDPLFAEWRPRHQQTLASDPLARYFYKLRSVLLKEGYLRATTAEQEDHIANGRNWVEVHTYFRGAPTEHLGREIEFRGVLSCSTCI